MFRRQMLEAQLQEGTHLEIYWVDQVCLKTLHSFMQKEWRVAIVFDHCLIDPDPNLNDRLPRKSMCVLVEYPGFSNPNGT